MERGCLLTGEKVCGTGEDADFENEGFLIQ